MKRICTSLFLSLISVLAFAQQEPQFTQNMFTNMAINPGYAGINKQICITSLFRQQWTGFTDTYKATPTGPSIEHKGAPQTILITIDAPVRLLHGGIGLTVTKDKLGFEDNIGAKLGYSFHLNVGPGILGIGAQFGLLNKTIDFAKFNPIDPNDPLISGKSKESAMMFDLTFGAFYNLPGKAYAGISSSQLIQSKMNIKGLEDSKLKRHYYLTGGYHWVIPNAPDWELSPYLLVKSDFASTQYDVTAMVKWRNMVWGGITYRHQDAVSILLGGYPFNMPSMNPALANLRIGYSYDITTSALGRKGRSNGTHEIMLGYCFKIEIPKTITKYINTRFL
jgi:type IX secretion system PorP/SprF family membrane protein